MNNDTRSNFTKQLSLTFERRDSILEIWIRSDQSDVDTLHALNELENLFEATMPEQNWIVDLSELQQIPIHLLGALNSYQVRLHEKRSTLSLRLGDQSRITEPTLRKIQSSFKNILNEQESSQQ